MTEEEVFHAALAKPTADRAAFLEQVCSGNAQLRESVEALLAAHTNHFGTRQSRRGNQQRW
jgi:hypothetical protein